jgi:hypothetical protein
VLKHLSLPLLAILALAGCRTNPACERQIGLMRSELLALEDKYYALEARYREAVGHDPDYDTCETLPTPIIESGQPSAMPPSQPSDSDIRIQIDPNDSSVIPHQAQPIAVDFAQPGEQSVVTFQTPRRFSQNAKNAPPVTPPNDPASRNVDASMNDDAIRVPEGSSPGNTQLILDADQLIGVEFDGQPGDDGLSLVLFVPRDRWTTDGQFTVSVLDPFEQGERQRIGLWSYSQQELVPSERESPDDGYVTLTLELPWNQRLPENPELLLFARWENANASPIELSQDVAINVGGIGHEGLPVEYEEEAATPRLAEGSSEASSADLDQARPTWKPNR